LIGDKIKYGPEMGKGGISQVYLGMCKVEGKWKRSAIKSIDMEALFGDAELMKAVESEVRIMETLNHANILKGYHHAVASNRLIVATELCACNLQDVISRQLAEYKVDIFNESEVLALMKYVATALQELGSRGIIYTDLRPRNIFLSPGCVKLGHLRGAIAVNSEQEARPSSALDIFQAPE